MPQPTDEPTTLEALKAHLHIDALDTDDDVFMQSCVDASCAWVRTLPVADIDATEWPATVALGTTMLAARWTRRRNSPDGVQAMTDQGAAFVARSDPDVSQLLRLGPYSKPAVM